MRENSQLTWNTILIDALWMLLFNTFRRLIFALVLSLLLCSVNVHWLLHCLSGFFNMKKTQTLKRVHHAKYLYFSNLQNDQITICLCLVSSRVVIFFFFFTLFTTLMDIFLLFLSSKLICHLFPISHFQTEWNDTDKYWNPNLNQPNQNDTYASFTERTQNVLTLPYATLYFVYWVHV